MCKGSDVSDGWQVLYILRGLSNPPSPFMIHSQYSGGNQCGLRLTDDFR